MEDISSLIREAKPMYFARKRRNNCISAFACLFLFAGMIGSIFDARTYVDYSFFLEDSAIYSFVDETSVVEDLGLPVDEYGLLMVS